MKYIGPQLNTTSILFFLFLLPASVIASEDAESIEELVVTGSSLPVAGYKMGNSISILDRGDIRNLGVEYAADVFRHVPGLAVNRSGGVGGLAQIRMRGAEGNHVQVLIDGIEVTSAGTGEFDFSSLLAADIEKIEVLRGPQSGLYGSNATAGVINIFTRSAEQGRRLDASIEGGSRDSWQGTASVAGGTQVINGRFNASYRTSKFDQSVDNSLIGEENDRDENLSLSASTNLAPNDYISFDAHARYNDRKTETDGFDFSGGPLQGLAIDDESEAKTEDLTIGLTGTLSLVGGRSISRFSVNYSENEIDATASGNESDRIKYSLQSTWQFEDMGSLANQSTVFVKREEETFRNTKPFSAAQVPKQERDLNSFGFQHRVDIGDSIFLSGIVRHDNNDAFEDVTTGSVNGTWLSKSARTRVHASFGVGVTNPTFIEQFGFDPGTFLGNPDLEPERSEAWDIGLGQRLLNDNLVVDLTYYHAILKDEIVGVFDNTLFLSTSVNAKESSDRQGVEVSLSYQPSDRLSFNGSYTYTDADEPAGIEIRRPEHTASASATWHFLDDRVRLSTNIVYNGEMQDTDFRNFFMTFSAERTTLDSFIVVNMNGEYSLSDRISLFARIENLFDEDYQEIISYRSPGIGAYAGLRFSMD